MTDRLPEAVALSVASSLLTERASATPTSTSAVHRPAKASSEGAKIPTSLDEVERWMVAAITGEQMPLAPASEVLTKGPKLDAEGRLDVYLSGYHARLVECLLDDYPVLAAFLGGDRFHELCHGYVAHHPSRSPNLNAFGRHMAAFCESDAASLGADVGMAAGLARIEWAIVSVLHAEVMPPLDLSPLAALPPEAWGDARFSPSDAVRIVHATHPVNAFLQTYRETGEVPAAPSASEEITAVFRTQESIWRMTLTPAMARVLEALLAREPLGAALETIHVDETDGEAIAEAERNVMTWFREWLGSGLFSGITLLDA